MRRVDPAKHRARRRQIAHAAVELFATKGFEATTTAEICRAAGVSTGTLFHYFSSKRDVFEAIVTDEEDETTARLAAATTAEDPWEGLLGFVDHLAASAAVPLVPSLVLEAMLQASRDAEFAAALDRDSADERAGVRALLDAVAATGQLDPDLDLDDTAGWVMALVGAVYLRGATDEDFDPAVHLPALRRTIERYLRRPAGA